MKTLVFGSSIDKISWLIVDGTQSAPKLLSSKVERIKFSAEAGEGPGLVSLLQTISLLLDAQECEQIAILQPGNSQFRSASPIRIKAEAVIQIAAAQKGKDVHLISPVTVKAHKRRLETDGQSLEKLVNRGTAFSPLDIGDLVGAGVVKLPNA